MVTMVTTASDTYGYRAYIETLLSYVRDTKQTQLTSSLYYKDEAGKFDELHLEAGQDGANPVNPGSSGETSSLPSLDRWT